MKINIKKLYSIIKEEAAKELYSEVEPEGTSRQSFDSADDQIDSFLIKFEKDSILDEEDQSLLESLQDLKLTALLEQEEDELDIDMGMGGPEEEGLPTSRALDQPTEEPGSSIAAAVDLAATDGERLCPCPNKGNEVEVSFEQLQDLMATLDGDGPEEELDIEEVDMMPGPGPDEALPDEEISIQEGVDLDEEIMLELDDLIGEDSIENANKDTISMADEFAAENESQQESLEADIRDDQVHKDDLYHDEEEERKHGWEAGAEEDHEHAIALDRDQRDDERAEYTDWVREAKARNKKVLQENNKLTKTNSQMLKENKQLLKEHTQILKEHKEMKSLLKKVSGKLQEVNLSNAKLIYTNQVLTNGTSLNERQKQRIVESINNADSVEAAKSIFETLQGAVGSSLHSRDKSQSLSEAIVRGNATTLRQKQKQTRQDPHIKRMKKLAGI